MNRTGLVYRVYDKSDRLIYIGCTHDLANRMKAHEVKSWWHGLIGRVDSTAYPTLEAGLAAEAIAIQEEAPVYNVMHRQGMWSKVRDFADWTAADIEVCRTWMREHSDYSQLPVSVRNFVFSTTDLWAEDVAA